jgi:hypothetical protein
MLIHFEQKYSTTNFVQNEWMKNDTAYYVYENYVEKKVVAQVVRLLNAWIHGLNHFDKVAVIWVKFSDEKYMFASFWCIS